MLDRGPCAYLIPYMDPVPQTDGTSAHAAGAVPRRRRAPGAVIGDIGGS